MTSKSLAICRLPNQSEIHLFQGSVNAINMELFEIPENVGFLFTEGLDPNMGYFLSGEARKVTSLEVVQQELRNAIAENFKFNSNDEKFNGKNIITLDSTTIPATFSEFTAEIDAVKKAIENDEVQKIVVARILKGDWIKWGNSETNTSPLESAVENLYKWYDRLCEIYTDCMVYLLIDPQLGCWIGASPELLLSQEQSGAARTVSLAGTLFEDSEHWSAKEKLEQSTTSQHVEEALNSLNIQFEISQLKEQRNGHLRHLISEYQFNLNSDQLLPLLRQLNPTPAVIGYPQKRALEWVKANLSLKRELYSGAVGMISKSESYLHVNLRCAKLNLNGMVDFYAGCGINLMSDPQREWEETELKSQVISRYLENH